MSATDPRTLDPAQPHPAENMGHEMSDFSWTTVLWLLPLSVITLIAFTFVSIYWFKRATDRELAETQQAAGYLQQLQLLHAHENQELSQYKWLDQSAGKVQIPIERAMELVVKEKEGQGGREYRTINDIYMDANPMVRRELVAAEPAEE